MAKRLYFLDWLRIIAVGAVFLVHCILPFAGGSWVVTDTDTSALAALFAGIFNQFGIPVLFFVSGSGVAYALRNRSPHQFIQERLKRLGIPFLFGVVLFSPLQTYFHLRKNEEFAGTLFHHYLPQFFRANHFTSRDFQWVGSYGYHLWFLFFLLVFSIVSLVLFLYLRRATHIIDRLVTYSNIRGSSIALVIPLLIFQIFLRANFPDYLSWADFIFWLLFFIYGYILVSDEAFIHCVERDFNLALMTLFLSLAMIIGIYVRGGDGTVLQDTVDFYSGAILFTVAVTLNSWSLVLILLILSKRWLNVHRVFLDRMTEAVLPFYLLHHPPIVVISFFVTQWEMSSGVKFVIITLSSLLLTIGIYEVFVRRFNVVRFLMGMRPLTKKVKTKAIN